jgi:hypothetical protein
MNKLILLFGFYKVVIFQKKLVIRYPADAKKTKISKNIYTISDF